MGFQERRVAIVTGANGGIGYGVCCHLLETESENLTLVMACRNPARANAAKEKLLTEFPLSHIEVEIVDISRVDSVLAFATAIKSKYTKVNYLFCNAGILSATGLNWKLLMYLAITDPVGLMERSDVAIQPMGEINEDGMGKVFASNVFGHYVMVRELETLLANSGDGRVLWTSSITASYKVFDINDWQGIKSPEPYESSKYACDLMAIALSERFEKDQIPIRAFTTSPGVVASQIGEFPSWVNSCRLVAHYMFRWMGVISQTISSYNGALANVYASIQPIDTMDIFCRYGALCDRWGNAYVDAIPLENYDGKIAHKLVDNCELAYQAFKKNATMNTAFTN